MNESIVLGGSRVAGFAIGDQAAPSPAPALARGALTGGVVGGAVGVLVDYTRTGRVGWTTPLVFAGVGAAGGALLGVI